MRRFPLTAITLFASWLSLMGGLSAKNPFPNFAGCIIIWLCYYLITQPRRRRRQYWRERRRLENECMRAYLHERRFR